MSAKGIIRVLIFIFVLLGCGNADDFVSESELTGKQCRITVEYDGSTVDFCRNVETDSLKREQDLFIWQSMNLFYFYQPDVSSLADDAFADYQELFSYLNRFSTSKDLFSEGLLSSNDRFSWIVDDYAALEKSFQGTDTSFGYEFRLLRSSEGHNNLFGYVKYVVEGGPADLAGLKRGDIFNKINNVQLTIDNYQDALYGTESYQITLAKIENSQVLSTDSTVALTAVQLTENPILFHDVVDLGGLKVGYLAYNQFVNNNSAHRQLNNVFGRFKSEGVQELVLDLRYNPGGSVLTTRILASLVYSASSSTEFGSIIYNDKLDAYFNRALYFLESIPIVNEDNFMVGEEPINSFNGLSRVFVLTSGSTASASELLIVGLSPYLEVITIGTTTVGKNEGSVTLYDSRNSLFRSNKSEDLNPNHTYAIQPIISKLSNSEGFSDYSGGLEPDVVIDEKDFLEDFKPLGDLEEPLLAKAVSMITGEVAARQASGRVTGYNFDYEDKRRRRLEKTLLDCLERK